MSDLFDKCFSFSRNPVVSENGVELSLAEAISSGIYPFFKAISSMNGPHCTVDGRDMIMVGSNNYLGLTTHPKVKPQRHLGTERLSGSGSSTDSRFPAVKPRLPFMGKEGSSLFYGFITNQGLCAALARTDTVIGPAGSSSILESSPDWQVRRFRHNDIESLRKNLEASADSDGILVIVDGVYSMEGDIAPLPEIVATAKEFGARIMVDDAHGLGVLGATGRGTLEHFGLTDQVDLVMGTFSKSFASLGGFVAGEERVISYIKHHSRALIFSASMPPSAIAAVQAALEVIETEPQIRERLWENTRFLMEQVTALGFDPGPTQTPIVPLIVGDDMRAVFFWKRLFDEGLFTNCVLAPGVQQGGQRIRMCLMATHSMEDLEQVVEICGRVGKEIGIIK
jgi:7-keto-8-aminopelargonate synthetase-like enzyme